VKLDPFAFQHNNTVLCGVICLPEDGRPVTGMVQTFGHGKTDVYESKSNDRFFHTLTDHGIACCAWDRAGCGLSEGTYNHNLSPKDSGLEAAAATQEFSKRTGLPLSRIGFI